MTEAEENAIREFERVRNDLVTSKLTGKSAHEGRYGKAYQKLVKLGLASKLKKKYRQGVK